MTLRRSDNRVLAGVLAGLAESWGKEPNVVRLVYVLLTIVTGLGPGLIVYLVLYLFMEDPIPGEPTPSS